MAAADFIVAGSEVVATAPTIELLGRGKARRWVAIVVIAGGVAPSWLQWLGLVGLVVDVVLGAGRDRARRTDEIPYLTLPTIVIIYHCKY